MTDTASTDAASAGLSMNEQQFTQLITTVAAALRQTSAPLSPDQQTVAFQFRLLRNGLGRFESASEKFDRALLRMDQVHRGGRSELVFRDPVPSAARSMVLVVGSERVPRSVPSIRGYGLHGHEVDGDLVEQIIERVEFLDQFDVPIAAGVPVQVQVEDGDGYLAAVLEVLDQGASQQNAKYSAKSRQSPRTPEES